MDADNDGLRFLDRVQDVLLRCDASAGGEGATAREVLRHKSVERCVMVDIDQARPTRPSRAAGSLAANGASVNGFRPHS